MRRREHSAGEPPARLVSRGEDRASRRSAAGAHLWPDDRAGDLASLFDELAELRAEYGAFVHATPERLELLRRYFVDSSREALQVACRVGEAFLAVDHHGGIKPCYRLPWSHGDARLTSVQAVWNSQAYARTRALIDACPLTCMNNCFFREKRHG